MIGKEKGSGLEAAHAAAHTQCGQAEAQIAFLQLVEQGAELRGAEVELSLMWDHMPLTGALYMGGQEEGTASKFVLPTEYN